MEIVIFLVLLAMAVGVAGWMWRINLVINHPEKNTQLENFEKKLREQQAEVFEKVTGGARKGIALALRMRRRFGK